MNVLETFASLQGEGVNMGIYATFIRLAGCNLDCQWCDTKDIMGRVAEQLTFDQIDAIIEANKTNHVIFTGGEPLLQQKQVFDFMKRYGQRWCYIETNGTIPVEPEDARLAHITVSPKLVSAFKSTTSSISPIDALFISKYSPLKIVKEWVHISGDIEFKFVISTDDDVEAFTRLMSSPPRGLSHHQIILQAASMPSQYTKYDQIIDATKWLIEAVKTFLMTHKNIRIGVQLHKLLGVQ
jgi:7-carboxy-7-deazaguanine synthase